MAIDSWLYLLFGSARNPILNVRHGPDNADADVAALHHGFYSCGDTHVSKVSGTRDNPLPAVDGRYSSGRVALEFMRLEGALTRGQPSVHRASADSRCQHAFLIPTIFIDRILAHQVLLPIHRE